MEDHHRRQDRETLRREAEDRASEADISEAAEMSEVDVRALLHELQVHQIELEMQNEELLHAKAEAEEALRRYSDLYDFAPVGYLTLNEAGKIVEVNLTASVMLGTPRSELVGFPFESWIADESRRGFRVDYLGVLESGGSKSWELTLLKAREHPFHALVEASADAAHNEHPPQCRITITDITRRKEAEDALQKAYEELEEKVMERTSELALARSEAERRAAEMESFVASMADGVILLDARGKITFINDIGMDILGVPLGAPLDVWTDIVSMSDLESNPVPPEKRAIYRALHGETVADMRGTLVTPWGKVATVSVSAAPVLSGEGEIIGATLVFRDQADRVAFEKERQSLLEREQRIAEILEQAVIRDVVPEVTGLKVAVKYEPALDEAGVGGDFYDIFELGDGKVGVLIGDVAGKGLAAAVGITAVRYAVRSYAYLDPRPSEVLTLTNEALCRGESGREEFGMLTAFFAVIDTRLGEISYSSGGHEPAILRAADGTIERLEALGTVVGVLSGVQYTEGRCAFRPI